MPFDTWITFVVASAVLIAIPGPTVMMLIGYGLARGRAIAFVTLPAAWLGLGLSMTLAVTGMGAILATSALLFSIMKFAGAAYLVWLGISLWRAPVPESGLADGVVETAGDRRRVFLHAFAVTALNPKLVAFYMAFLPQFIDTTRPLAMQAVILTLTTIAVSAVLDTVYAMAAGSARGMLKKPSFIRTANRIGGSFLIGAGAVVATMRRAA